MKLSLIAPDHMLVTPAGAFILPDGPWPANVRALQWDGDQGVIERFNGDNEPAGEAEFLEIAEPLLTVLRDKLAAEKNVAALHHFAEVADQPPAVQPWEKVEIDAVIAEAGGFRTEYVVLTPAVSELKAEKLAELADFRWQQETAGITVSGVSVRTDRESQGTLNSAYLAVQRNPDAVLPWKGENGWANLGKVEIEALADAVIAHVQGCFLRERVLSERVLAKKTHRTVYEFNVAAEWSAEVV